MLTVLPLFLQKIGFGGIALIVLLFLVLFGGRKIPELMRGLGRGVKEFKDAVNKDYSSEIDNPTDEETKKNEPKA